MNPPPYNAIIHGKILQVSILNIAIALTFWTKAIYIEREPQSHVVIILGTKEAVLKEWQRARRRKV